jgi:hypothetical protein
MKKIKLLICLTWAFPLTFFGLIYALVFQMLKWYKFCGIFDNAIVWRVDEGNIPFRFRGIWRNWSSHCIGNVIIIKKNPLSRSAASSMKHAQEHVRQCMVLGIFQPILFLLFSLVIRMSLKKSHHYFSNPFEIEARRVSGETIDIESAIQKLKKVKNV